MFDWISYKYNMYKLWRKRNRYRKQCNKEVAVAKKSKKDSEEIQNLVSGWCFEINCIDEEIQAREGEYLLSVARKYLLPSPRDTELWEEPIYYMSKSRILTIKGISELRAMIRKETKERREAFLLWCVAITGIIGALTGLLAVWKS